MSGNTSRSATRASRPASGGDDELIQLLAPDGELREHPDYPLEVTPDEARGLYRDMVLVRRMDSEAVALQRHGELGLWASLLGQEAAQVGSARALQPADMAFPSYREHGVAWCRGLPFRNLLAMFRGVTNGGWDPAAYNFHLYTVVIGTQCLHATGYAMGVQRDDAVGDDGQAVIAYFGDGATSQGDTNESFVYAAVNNAPVVFFCQNNQWAISEPMERQSRIPLYRRAEGFGFPGVRIDGNDVFAALAVTRRMLADVRRGEGPALIEAFTYRMGAHTTTDDPTRYRIAEELEEWKAKDPIARLRAYLATSGHADEEFFGEVDAEADRLGEEVRAECRNLPDPPATRMFDDVYAEPHSLLQQQRAEFLEYLNSFEGTVFETAEEAGK